MNTNCIFKFDKLISAYRSRIIAENNTWDSYSGLPLDFDKDTTPAKKAWIYQEKFHQELADTLIMYLNRLSSRFNIVSDHGNGPRERKQHPVTGIISLKLTDKKESAPGSKKPYFAVQVLYVSEKALSGWDLIEQDHVLEDLFMWYDITKYSGATNKISNVGTNALRGLHPDYVEHESAYHSIKELAAEILSQIHNNN